MVAPSANAVDVARSLGVVDFAARDSVVFAAENVEDGGIAEVVGIAARKRP